MKRIATIFGAFALSILALLAASPTAQAGTGPGTVCLTDGGWTWTESNPATNITASSFTDAGLQLDITGSKAAGYLAVDTLLSDIKSSTFSMDYAAAIGASPGYQLVVYKGATWYGTLVNEPAFDGNHWWSTKPGNWPTLTVGQNVSTATLADYAAAEPTITVKAIGFSLGTLGAGIQAKGTLKSLTFGAKVYTFGTCYVAPTTTTTPVTSTTTSTSTTTVSPTSTTTTTPSSSTSTTTVTTSPSSSMAATTPAPTTTSRTVAVGLVGDTGNLAYTGVNKVGLLTAIGALLLCVGALGFIFAKKRTRKA